MAFSDTYCKKCGNMLLIGYCVLCWLEQYSTPVSSYNPLPWSAPQFSLDDLVGKELTVQLITNVSIVPDNWTDEFREPPDENGLFELGQFVVTSLAAGIFAQFGPPRHICFGARWLDERQFSWVVSIKTHFGSEFMVEAKTDPQGLEWLYIAATIQSVVVKSWEKQRKK